MGLGLSLAISDRDSGQILIKQAGAELCQAKAQLSTSIRLLRLVCLVVNRSCQQQLRTIADNRAVKSC